MSPRPNVSDERKGQIISAAQEVFTQRGFDEARMEDIAGQTGLSKGTLYLYFKSKDELITAILDRIVRQEFRQFENLGKDQATASAAIRDLTDVVTRDVGGLVRILPIIYNFLALAFRNKHVQRSLKAYLNRYLDILAPLIQRGIDSGEFHPADAREVAVSMAAIVEGTLLLWVYDSSHIDPRRHIHSGVELLLEGLRAHA